MSDLELGTALLEIGTEELPPRFGLEALEQLSQLAEKYLKESHLDYQTLKTYGTPRRLALEISGLIAHQPTLEKELRGPAKATAYDANGNPTPALMGFLKGHQAPVESVSFQEVSGKPYVFIKVIEPGKETIQVLSQLLPEIIGKMTFPKQMRWEGNFSFGRPIRWVLAMFEEKLIPFDIAGLPSETLSYGYRFLTTKPIQINKASTYKEQLEKAYVIVDPQARADRIRAQIESLLRRKSARPYLPDSLLPEVTWLLEYPTSFIGTFDERFLALPQEVLITVMQHHQRYFPLISNAEQLLPYFIAVRNGDDKGIDDIRSGNEHVLRARFKDAEYFFATDKKIRMIDRLEKLERLIFQKDLGTLRQKVERLSALTRHLVHECRLEQDIKPHDLNLAVCLCKCDLTTQMVFELPELQGVMGKEYASLEGYSYEVSQAIVDHYLPRFSGDRFPLTKMGAILGIADRMDTLVGCFSLKAVPSGSSDPLGLRRAAATLLQVIAKKNLPVDLERLSDFAYAQYQQQFEAITEDAKETVLSNLNAFLLERNESLWKTEDIRYDLIRTLTPVILKSPAHALQRARFLETQRTNQKEKFDSCIMAWVRVFNILKAKEVKAFTYVLNEPPNADVLKEPEEKALWESVKKSGPDILHAMANGDIEKTWNLLCEFEAPIHQFFEKVLVMAPETPVRKARVQLLAHVQSLMLNTFGDLTQLVSA